MICGVLIAMIPLGQAACKLGDESVFSDVWNADPDLVVLGTCLHYQRRLMAGRHHPGHCVPCHVIDQNETEFSTGCAARSDIEIVVVRVHSFQPLHVFDDLAGGPHTVHHASVRLLANADLKALTSHHGELTTHGVQGSVHPFFPP
jgi:hypothetical protein